jgi:hypothetical protein
VPYGLPDSCICGMTYRRFRAPEQPSFAEVKEAMYVSTDDPKKWKRRSRGVVLGKMHEHKVTAWREHIRQCEEAADLMDWIFSDADPVPF